MNGFLASLRFPFALRGAWSAAAVPSIAPRVLAADAGAHAPFRGPAHPNRVPSGGRAFEAPPVARPSAAVETSPEPASLAPLLPLPVEPSVPVSAAHLVDPVGLRVVPFRPSTRWPLRRAAPRIYDPFRGFPLRSVHLADLMDRGAAKR